MALFKQHIITRLAKNNNCLLVLTRLLDMGETVMQNYWLIAKKLL